MKRSEPPSSGPPLAHMPGESNITQNRAGEWVPAIPVPFYSLRKHCTCGRKFWTEDGYRGHYALAHILRLDR